LNFSRPHPRELAITNKLRLTDEEPVLQYRRQGGVKSLLLDHRDHVFPDCIGQFSMYCIWKWGAFPASPPTEFGVLLNHGGFDDAVSFGWQTLSGQDVA
jgi:hypothetical protein